VCFPRRRNCSCKIYASRLCQGSGFKSPASHRLRPGFNPRPDHVRFLVDQVTIGQVLPRVFRNSSVSMVTTLRPGRYGVWFPAGATNFSLLANALISSGIQPTSSSMRTEGGGVLSLGLKRPKRKADHSPTSNVEVTNEWSYTSAPLYACMT